MSAFEQEKSPVGKKTWADSESESDHDEDHRGKRSVGRKGGSHDDKKHPEGQVTQEQARPEHKKEEEEEDDDEEEEEEEEEEAVLGAITQSTVAKKTPKQPERPMSRKEREELRRKELE
ncbi:hypothetical protein EON64_13825, partial [archaeon]